ncbi:23104_t:CDS:2, partial [Gigaspora rosea]
MNDLALKTIIDLIDKNQILFAELQKAGLINDEKMSFVKWMSLIITFGSYARKMLLDDNLRILQRTKNGSMCVKLNSRTRGKRITYLKKNDLARK